MRSIGVGILLVGIVILLFGLISSQSLTEKVVEGVSGQPSYLMEYLFAGLILLAGGAALVFLSRNQK